MFYFQILWKVFSQFATPSMIAVFFKSLFLTLLLSVGVVWSIVWGIDCSGMLAYLQKYVSFFPYWNFASHFFISYLIFTFLSPMLLIIVSGFFLETMADLVERKFYKSHPKGREIPIFLQIKSMGILLFFMLFLNLLMLPLYFFPVVNIFIFYSVNGYLIGREYFELIALRHLKLLDYRRLWKKHFLAILIGGIICAVGITLPIINLLMPFFATCLMVHLFHALQR